MSGDAPVPSTGIGEFALEIGLYSFMVRRLYTLSGLQGVLRTIVLWSRNVGEPLVPCPEVDHVKPADTDFLNQRAKKLG